MKMNAIVLAGGIPQPNEPLYRYSQGGSKALIDVAGKPMVQWIVDALAESKSVDQIIIIGLSQKSELACSKPLHYISNQGRMLANIVAGSEKSFELKPNTDHLLVCSADIPALRGSMVDWLVKTAMQTEDDLYYGVCPKEVMEARYPESKRTYTKLKDIELCGADINITRISIIKEHMDVWEALIGNRKSPMRQAGIIGFDTLFQLATRQFTLESLVERASERIGIKGRAIVWQQAEPCMDVDKPHQLELMREDLTRQIRSEKAKARAAAKK
ncbi:MAG: nucleotidyltransferase family protein [Anaerolineales bacterium]|jgi:molybdopterin-guanine dinucleotide biosynthesis protein A|uniref:nucleotidyltransferase family protein n=1 Tax=Candidatus Villigracilis vicinus TaxID=3140679 RepID=UPI003135C616|nr:nucleotidyltransferase family protein [Anaerolineales bacterium]MBK9781683.1 nucleotidyltransferase family protein [Anaerolineales bacterium]